MGNDFRAGDVLSYSAGTTQTGPDGFRFIRRAGESAGADMLGAVGSLRPELLGLLGDQPPLLLNGYPASTGDFSFGVQVDSYLSIPVALRALQLARREAMCSIVLAQPLWLAELLVRADELPNECLPPSLIAAVGGYPLPQSLQTYLTRLAASHGTTLAVAELFGIAELDAGCLISSGRDEQGRTVFHPRSDIRIGDDNGTLTLSRRRPDGSWSHPESSGDRFERMGDDDVDGVVILEGTRVAPEIRSLLESWTDDFWRRRTGYLRRDGDTIRAQTRHGVAPAPAAASESSAEEEHHEFARHGGASYLTKPDWR